MSYDVTVDRHGPAFNGMAEHQVGEFLREAVWEITKEARGDLGVQFIRVFREPTGYYESRVEAVRPIETPAGPVGRVHDNSVIYGWWLEGISSRNFPVTRFRGYYSFRLVTQHVQRKAANIAERALEPFLRRMNGGA